jgi:hypothetical protein
MLKLKHSCAIVEDCLTIACFKVNGKLQIDCYFVLYTSNSDDSDAESVVSNDKSIVLVRISYRVTKKTEVEFQ